MIEWDAENLGHIRRHRGITPRRIEEALSDPMAVIIESRVVDGEQWFVAIGADATGRLLEIVYIERGDNLRIITAYRPGSSSRRAYEEE